MPQILGGKRMTPEIKVELSGSGVLTVTIARPDKKNALTNDMYGALADAIARDVMDLLHYGPESRRRDSMVITLDGI